MVHSWVSKDFLVQTSSQEASTSMDLMNLSPFKSWKRR